MANPIQRLSQSVIINAPIESVFHFHDDTRNLLKITPPNISVTIEALGTPGKGSEIILRVRQFGLFTMRWHVRITQYLPPTRMTDEQISGPFSYWKQERHLSIVEGGTELTDVVEYRMPFGLLGRFADALIVRRQIQSMFDYRQNATRQLLESSNLGFSSQHD